jgi:hypothetical protein
MAKKPDAAPVEVEVSEAIESDAENVERPVRRPQRRVAQRKKDAFNAQQIRGKSREFLDLLRSFVTVAVICYAASKSEAWYLWALAFAAKFALGVYALSYVINYLGWFQPKRSSKWLEALLSLAFVLAAYLALNAAFVAVNITIDQLIRVRM